ncbi:MAG: hypothetical protein IJ610_08655 [Bacteroidaceae bacterium]|nr:hypothetical protein [Bacteroidaceae bacterium]
MNEYQKFDYFSTSDDKLWIHKCNLEKYGLTLSEVKDYIYQMNKDRLQWEEKRKKFDEWGPVLQLFVSVVAVFIYALISTISYEIFKESSYICTTLSTCFLFLLVVFEYYIWKNVKVLNRYDKWLEKKYKKKTQYNPIIEKLLDDANFEHWKFSNELQREFNERQTKSN